MSIQLWTCCGKNYVQGVKTCKVCGNPQKRYGILPDDPEPAKQPKKPTAAKETPKKAKKRRTRDEHISDNEEQLYVSTLMTQDGNTYADLEKERNNK